jgi:PAS domain S-box-containing protein
MAIEVTGRQGLGEALSEARDSARATLNASGHAVITTDTVGLVVALNDEASSLLRRPSACARGMPVDAVVFLTDDEGEPSETSLLPALEAGRPIGTPEPGRLVHADGTHVPVEHVASPVRDHAGRVVGGVLVLREIRSGGRQAPPVACALAPLSKRASGPG